MLTNLSPAEVLFYYQSAESGLLGNTGVLPTSNFNRGSTSAVALDQPLIPHRCILYDFNGYFMPGLPQALPPLVVNDYGLIFHACKSFILASYRYLTIMLSWLACQTLQVCAITLQYLADLGQTIKIYSGYQLKLLRQRLVNLQLKRYLKLLTLPTHDGARILLHDKIAARANLGKPRFKITVPLVVRRKIGLLLLLMACGGFLGASLPFLQMEMGFAYLTLKDQLAQKFFASAKISEPVKESNQTPIYNFNPLVSPDGSEIVPVNNDFVLVIPKIGVNAPIIAGVNPLNTAGYEEALKKGVAHSNTSFYPNENGTVYLFSHSTNYEWFVKDLNAVFYLLKNIKEGDLVVIMYLGNRYTYKIRESKVVKAKEISYLIPQTGKRNLILQTCWPPGTSYQRLLIFADLVEEKLNTDQGKLMVSNYRINTNNPILKLSNNLA